MNDGTRYTWSVVRSIASHMIGMPIEGRESDGPVLQATPMRDEGDDWSTSTHRILWVTAKSSGVLHFPGAMGWNEQY